MKKILMILSVASLMVTVACNRSENTHNTSKQQREESRNYEDDRTIEREEAIDYETDKMGRPVDEVQVDEVERRIED